MANMDNIKAQIFSYSAYIVITIIIVFMILVIFILSFVSTGESFSASKIKNRLLRKDAFNPRAIRRRVRRNLGL